MPPMLTSRLTVISTRYPKEAATRLDRGSKTTPPKQNCSVVCYNVRSRHLTSSQLLLFLFLVAALEVW